MKILKIGIFLGICYSAAIGLSLNAAAQAQEPAIIIKSTHEAWRIQCTFLGNATVSADELARAIKPDYKMDKSKQRCQMMQQIRSQENKSFGLLISLMKAPTKENPKQVVMRIVAPLGVFLPSGLALEIDETAKGRINYTNCIQGGCLAQSPMADELLKSFKLGGTANFIVYQAPGRGLPMSASLKGFSAAYKALLAS